MSKESVNFLELFKDKKYSLIISIIEGKISEKERSPGLLNLLGICKLMEGNNSKESLISALENFRASYLKEKDKKNAIHQLKNFINAATILFDKEFYKNETEIDSKLFDEIFLYFNENKELFENNSEIVNSIIKVYRRNNDVINVIKYLQKLIKISPNTDAFSSLIYFNNYLYDWDQLKHLENSKTLNDMLPLYSTSDLIEIDKSKNKINKINIGFISSDIKEKHSVTYFLRSVLTIYDSNKFNIYIYHNHNTKDETTSEFEKLVNKVSYINKLNDIETINLIRKDGIDIIIDLNGFSSNHRLSLFKNRLAPIQVSWCGYTNTTGINEMDYLLVDKNLILQNEKELYSEKIIYLPNIWNCHSGYNKQRFKKELPVKQNNYITFGSFNNFRKINDDVINVWSSILKELKNSKLILKTSVAAFKLNLQNKFKKNGVIDSVKFLPFKSSFDDHLNAYNKIDISLDTFPWNGVTTSFESMWMDVPVITMKGFNFNSRCGESINKNLKLEDLIAQNKEDYINKAVSLANDVKRLEQIRNYLNEKLLDSPLFNKKEFSEQFFFCLEKIYR